MEDGRASCMPIPMQVASRAGGFGWRKLDGRWEKGCQRRCFFVCDFVCETSATRCHVVAGQKTRSTGQQHRKSLQNSNWRCVCRRLSYRWTSLALRLNLKCGFQNRNYFGVLIFFLFVTHPCATMFLVGKFSKFN